MSDKIKVGIVTDDHKVDFFKQELNKLEYEHTIGDGITKDTKMIYIEFEPSELFKLQGEIKRINEQARKRKMN